MLVNHCRYCATPTPGVLCSACDADLPWLRASCPLCALPMPVSVPCPRCSRRAPPVAATRAAFVLAEPVHSTLLGLKYHRQLADARWLAAALVRQLGQGASPPPHALVPVPLHWRRLWRRGFNQAAVLAAELGRGLRCPVLTRGICRSRATPDQIGQAAAARRRAVRGAFEIDIDLRGRHLAIIDDVMTTGATVFELARSLRAAGAERVEAWVIARTPAPGTGRAR
jgi:ComF family protein